MTVSVSTLGQQALRRLGVRIVPLDDSPDFTDMVDASTIATNALIELGVIASDETPSPSDQAFLEDKVLSVHAALDAQGVVYWSGPGMPRAFAEEYTKLAAAYAASSFGKAADPQVVAMLEARVRKGVMVLSADDNANQAVQAIHDDLAMRGLVRWSSLDIPEPVGEAYTILAADRMAPLFEAQTDPRDTAAAMVAIYRYIALPSSDEPVATTYF